MDAKIRITDCYLVQSGGMDKVEATLRYITDSKGATLEVKAEGVKLFLDAREVRKLLGKKEGR